MSERLLPREIESRHKIWTSLENNERCKKHAEFHEKVFFGRIDARTDIGGPNSKYEDNEDSFCVVYDKNYVFFAIIDGAGGSRNGELASAVANIKTIREAERRKNARTGDLSALILAVDERIRTGAPKSYAVGVFAELSRLPSGGTEINLGSVGDAKIFTIREGKKVETGTTAFQNYAQARIDRSLNLPYEYYTHPQLNVITASLGTSRGKENLQTLNFVAQKGDTLVMADDGIWDNISEYEILELWKKFRGTELEQKLFELAYARNNITKPFNIQHDEATAVEKTLSYIDQDLIAKGIDQEEATVPAGDNLTLGVLSID